MSLSYITKLNRLKKLSEEAGANYFERIKLADELLADKNWISNAFGDGEDYKAAESLEEDYFHDLCGSMSIFDLLEIYRKFNDEKEWKKYRYNLKVLFSKCRAARTETKTVTRISKAEYEAVQAEANEVKAKLNFANKDLKSKASRIQELEDRVDELENENAELRGRVTELERILHGKLSQVS